MKRMHRMPFGCTIQADGSILFRLFAPDAEQVSLCLQEPDNRIVLPMQQHESSFFELSTDQARVGMQYQFVIDDKLAVPDPASRYQTADVHGPSEIIDPLSFHWEDSNWQGRPWEESVFYELHTGTFTPEGNFAAVKEKLAYLADLGITAIELMPIADFPGKRGWGYDGVLLFAPESSYGRPEELKMLIQSAHQAGLMVFLDVVYNHFGPEGNYLHVYAKSFFSKTHQTPWGAAINFDGPDSEPVRQFFIHNALYWLEEYNLDGLRLDAVHAIKDCSDRHILQDISAAVRATIPESRQVHLILENDNNESKWLKRQSDCKPSLYTAQWNDDIHHSFHVLLTNEASGYYCEYTPELTCRPVVETLGRALAEGFVYQGDASSYRGGKRRGEPSKLLPGTAFVAFIQNHDQIGNRAFGERITQLSLSPEGLKAALAILLLSPQPPLIFFGQEWAASSPFLYFCDLEPELAPLVTAGRRNEFARFSEFSDPMRREAIPDPCLESTFKASVLDWQERFSPEHLEWLQYYRKLLEIRSNRIIPLLAGLPCRSGQYSYSGGVLSVSWEVAGMRELQLIANLSAHEILSEFGAKPDLHEILFQTFSEDTGRMPEGSLLPWSVLWILKS